jgi:Homeodomain-like domain
MALTERQQEIKKLLDEGKTPREVGEALGISENAVYQHRRRMQASASKPARRGSHAAKASTSKPAKAASKPAQKRSAPRKRTQSRPAAPASAPAAPEAMDPLSAVRHRRDEISLTVTQAKEALDEAAKAHAAAQKAHDDAEAKVKPELERLTAVEALLTGKLKPPVPRSRKAEAEQAPAPAAPAPEPEQQQQDTPPETTYQDTPDMPEAEAQDAAAEAPDEPTEVAAQGNGQQERPGVPTLDEFKQEDAFASTD